MTAPEERRQRGNLALRVAFAALERADAEVVPALGLRAQDGSVVRVVRAREVLAALREAGLLVDTG